MYSQSCEELLIAVKNNDIKTTASLLKTVNPNCYYLGVDQPRSPLGMAARNGNLTIAKLLLKNGAKVSYRYKRDASALMISARNGHYDFVNYLIQNNANVNKVISLHLRSKY
jgi:ankyrin repeat protein